VDPELRARREEEILDAAADLFARHGYARTETQMLADRLGVGKGTIYRYFPSKEALFRAAVDRGMRHLQEWVEAEVADVADPLDRISRAIHAFLAYFEKHPGLVELFVQERAQFHDRKKPAYFAHHEANVGPWRELYRKLVAEGCARDLPDADNQDVVSDLLYGTVLANYFTGRRVPYPEQARHIVDIVFHGILTDAERRRRSAKNGRGRP
jgi:AcrR family transcriptional regulator